MKKLTTNSKLIGCLMGLSIVALGTGCTDSDYDLSSVDSTIGVGGEGLELPTSSTENIILDDVLKLNNSDFVKIAANGDYMFNKDGDEATPSHPYINKIWVEKANVNNNFRLHITLPNQSAGARRAKLSNPVTAEGKLAEFHYTGAASNDIRELKEASVSSDVEISVAVSADLKRAVKTFKTLTLTVPSYMCLDLRQCSPSQPDYDAAKGVVTFHNVSSTANIKLRAAVKTLDFQKPATTDNKLRFTPGQDGKDGQVDLNGVLKVGVSFDEIDYAQSGGDLYLSANMSMGSITVHEATGKFDPEISLRDLGRTTIGSVPDFLTDGQRGEQDSRLPDRISHGHRRPWKADPREPHQGRGGQRHQCLRGWQYPRRHTAQDTTDRGRAGQRGSRRWPHIPHRGSLGRGGCQEYRRPDHQRLQPHAEGARHQGATRRQDHRKQGLITTFRPNTTS